MYQEPRQPSQTVTKTKSFDFKWEKRHWILLVGLTCLVFWYFAPQVKTTPWLQSALNLLPAIGGIAFALETILKLSQ